MQFTYHFVSVGLLGLLLAGCGAAPATTSSSAPAASGATSTTASTGASGATKRPLTISAIPDQDPEKLQRLYGKVAAYLSKEIGIPVEYKPVTDYTASVSAFKTGDLDLVWYGGLTGVQARLQVPGAQAIAQRDIDTQFHSIFIANKASGIRSLTDVKGHTFTFGSDTSTSGRLMPQYFLKQAGVNLTDIKGQAGFSGSHDKTIALVSAGTFDAGALNEQVWKSRVKDGTVDLNKVQVIATSPAFVDYHWVINPEATKRYGADITTRVQNALFKLSPDAADQKEILDLFGASKFIPTKNENYAQIEAVGREIGKITP